MKKKIIFGFHSVKARIQYCSSSIKKVYINVKRSDSRINELLKLASFFGISVIKTSIQHISNIVGNDSHQGVVAEVDKFYFKQDLDDFLTKIIGVPLFLVLDCITDPHNLGACFRVADAVGVNGIINLKNRAVHLNSIAIKVASGAAEKVPYFIVTNLVTTMKKLKKFGIMLVGMSENSKDSLYDHNFNYPIALILGSENNGIRRLIRENCDFLIKIPMFGLVESLNVSVAAAVCLYEIRRQHILKKIN